MGAGGKVVGAGVGERGRKEGRSEESCKEREEGRRKESKES